LGFRGQKKDAGVRMGRGGQILSSGSGDGRLPELTACSDGQRLRRNDTEDGRWRTEPSGSGDSGASQVRVRNVPLAWEVGGSGVVNSGGSGAVVGWKWWLNGVRATAAV
jgi:hypothetical protein